MIPLLIVDEITKETLFEMTLPVLKEIRINHATPKLDLTFKIISMLGSEIGSMFVTIISFYFLDVERSFLLMFTNCTALALLSFLKSIYHEARPFHVYDI